MEINLKAVVRGTQLGIHYMRKSGKGGVIINTSSLAGLVPQKHTPVYSAVKAGVVQLSRSLYFLEDENIRVVAICPSFTESAITAPIKDMLANIYGKYGTIMPVEMVVEGFVELVTDKHKKGGGAILRITPSTGRDYPSIFNTKPRL